MSEINETLKERGSTHGDFQENSDVSQKIKKILRDSLNWEDMSPDQQECLDMTAHKIGRILSGDYNFHDHWHDCAGYFTLVANRLAPKKEEVKPKWLPAGTIIGFEDGKMEQRILTHGIYINENAVGQESSFGISSQEQLNAINKANEKANKS